MDKSFKFEHYSNIQKGLPTLTLDVINRRAQLLQKLLETIANTMQIRAKANRLENCIRSLLDLSVVHPTEPQLLSMEGRSVRTVDSPCCPKSDQGFITSGQLAVAEEPRGEPPLMFKLRVRQTIKPARHSAKCLRNLIKDFLSRHWNFPLL